ncbi:hypothetical protein TRAPUB_3997 [Trametes pubescens]|uniref:Uncharacterized protein n=1 Tax=Trametes pubescens TaxID=154538 RepID=A0A1M2VC50_TRAPU|nr:hypothetical protein TRAPUB_3997 [Trametes pubescens]
MVSASLEESFDLAVHSSGWSSKHRVTYSATRAQNNDRETGGVTDVRYMVHLSK